MTVATKECRPVWRTLGSTPVFRLKKSQGETRSSEVFKAALIRGYRYCPKSVLALLPKERSKKSGYLLVPFSFTDPRIFFVWESGIIQSVSLDDISLEFFDRNEWSFLMTR